MDEPAMRLAALDDLPVLLTLVAEFCKADGHPFEASRVERALLPLLESDLHGVVWLIGDPAEGYAVLTWNYSLESGGRDALLDEIYLRQRGRGTGSRALQRMHDDLRGRGIARVFLETEDHNERARRFYTRNGYSTEASIWMLTEL